MKEYSSNQRYSLRSIGLAIYICALPFANLEMGVIGSLLKYIALIPIGINLLMLIKNNKIRINSGQVWLFIFTILILISNLYSIDTSQSMQRGQTYVMFLILIVFSTMFPYSSEEINFLRNTLFLSGVMTAICVILFSGTLDGGVRLTLGATGIFREDPNYLCGYFMFPIIYAIDKCMNKSNERVYKQIISILIFSIIIFMTGSRGGLIGIVAGIASYYLLDLIFNKKSIQRFLKVTIGVIVAVVMVNIIIGSLSVDLQQRYSIEAVLDSKGTGRFELWGATIKMYRQSDIISQVLGYGAGTVRLIYVEGLHLWNVVHNFWLETLLEQGFIGMVSIGISYWCFSKQAIKSKDIVSLASIIGFMAMTMSLSLYAYKPLWNVFIIISLYSKSDKLEHKKEESFIRKYRRKKQCCN